jgi:predicted aspartyl protease
VAKSILYALAALTLTGTSLGGSLELRSNRVYIPVIINGTATEALLDSAAEMTFVDTRLAEKIGLKPEGSETAQGSGGSTQVRFAKNVNISGAGVQLENLTVALLDMTELSKKVVNTELGIILGREYFDAARVRIDIEGRTIEKLDAAHEPMGVKLPLTSARGIEHFPAVVEGTQVGADIDLGNGSEVLIGRKFAEKIGLLAPGRVVEKKTGGGIGGTLERDIVVLKSITIAGVPFENVRAAIDPQPTAGDVNVGTSILRHFVLVIDFGAHAVWFEPRP